MMSDWIYMFMNVVNNVTFARKKVRVGENIKIKGIILVTGRGRLEIGNNVSINSCRSSNPIGGDTKTILNTMLNGEIRIGNDCGLSNCAIVARKSVIIGDGVKIGGGVQIFDNDFHSLDATKRNSHQDIDNVVSKAVVIKNGAFIGARALILKGVTIGANSIIGAGSVVAKSIPDNEVWAGNPAEFIKKCS